MNCPCFHLRPASQPALPLWAGSHPWPLLKPLTPALGPSPSAITKSFVSTGSFVEVHKHTVNHLTLGSHVLILYPPPAAASFPAPLFRKMPWKCPLYTVTMSFPPVCSFHPSTKMALVRVTGDHLIDESNHPLPGLRYYSSKQCRHRWSLLPSWEGFLSWPQGPYFLSVSLSPTG